MKIRFGLVSNSSSSSYIILMTEDQHNQAVKKISGNKMALKLAAWLRKRSRRTTFSGLKCLSSQVRESEDYTSYDDLIYGKEEEKEEYWENRAEYENAFATYIQALKQAGAFTDCYPV